MDEVSRLKHVTQMELVDLLKEVPGEKDLVLDPDLMTMLNHFTTATFLKQNGVSKIYRLEATVLDSPCINRIYLIRPRLPLVSIIIDDFLANAQKLLSALKDVTQSFQTCGLG